MSNFCSYKARDKCTLPKEMSVMENRACFSDMYYSYNFIEEVKYLPKLPRKEKFSQETVNWFLNQLEEFGFKFDKKITEKGLEIKVKVPKEIIREPLLTLMALRYLDVTENAYYIVLTFKKLVLDFPNLDKFSLFQLAHYLVRIQYEEIGGYLNVNHLLIDSLYPRCKLITLDHFWKEAKILRKDGYDLSIGSIFHKEIIKKEDKCFYDALTKYKIKEIVKKYVST